MGLTKETVAWLRANCHADLSGKTIVITGATSGVGFKEAEIALYLGMKVIIACRNTQKAEACRKGLLSEYPDSDIEYLQLDLSDLASIDSFVNEIIGRQQDVDVFVNNAGALHHPGEKTKDGFDLVIGTNYMGVFRLTEGLLPYLKSLDHGVTYINTVSAIIRLAGKIDYDDFYCERHPGRLTVYGRSKICLATYTYALAKQNEESNVKIVMNHPGATITPLGLNAYGRWANSLAGPFSRLMNSPEKSALSVAYILGHDVPAGGIAGPKRGFWLWGYPAINRLPGRVQNDANELITFTEGEIAEALRRE